MSSPYYINNSAQVRNIFVPHHGQTFHAPIVNVTPKPILTSIPFPQSTNGISMIVEPNNAPLPMSVPEVPKPKITLNLNIPRPSGVPFPLNTACNRANTLLPQPVRLPITSKINNMADNTQVFLDEIRNDFRVLNRKRDISPGLTYPMVGGYSSSCIDDMRNAIHDIVCKKLFNGISNPDGTKVSTLNILFYLYDEVFFQGRLMKIMLLNNIKIKFDLSVRMTSVAGHCEKIGNNFEIRLSLPVIFGTFKKGEQFHISNGLKCYDRIECLMNVFEHELVHFVVQIVHGHINKDDIYGYHGTYFQQLMRAYFGHTEFKHSLKGHIENLGKREDFTVGDYVTYKSNTGEMVTGRIDRLNPKRAVIGDMTVPYGILKPATKEEITKSDDNKTTQNDKSPEKDQITFRAGDIVSYKNKDEVVTGRIESVNVKTFTIGNFRVPKSCVYMANDMDRSHFLSTPSAPKKSASDFYVGQHVKFTSKKTGQVVTGYIIKFNPTRAIVDAYKVPYSMLSSV